jgi:hypothetical protein
MAAATKSPVTSPPAFSQGSLEVIQQLSLVIENHLAELERLHGAELLPSHRQVLRAMTRCRRQGSDLMVLECPDCKSIVKIPHSCGHRSCPHCQHHESQQ